jgi:crotonobetainyl-CoA:carnitine CoA-transferase CaiB-like acyl-CoA transferase
VVDPAAWICLPPTSSGAYLSEEAEGGQGNSLDIAAPVGNYASRYGRYVYLVGGSQVFFERLCRAMDRSELAVDERFANAAARAHNRAEINAMVAQWVSELDSDEAEAHLVACDVPAGKIYDVADMAADEHVQARGDICTVQGPIIGPVRQQAPFPRLLGETPQPPAGAPRLGEHTDEVLSSVVGLSGTELEALRADRVI